VPAEWQAWEPRPLPEVSAASEGKRAGSAAWEPFRPEGLGASAATKAEPEVSEGKRVEPAASEAIPTEEPEAWVPNRASANREAWAAQAICQPEEAAGPGVPARRGLRVDSPVQGGG